MQNEISVVIPAAGAGRRMKSYGPKSLLPLSPGRTVIRRQIDTIRHVWPGVDIVVVVGFDADKVIKTLPDGVRVVENERYEDTSVVRSITMGLRATTSPHCLVLYGDLVFNRATIASLPVNRSSVVVDSKGQLPSTEVGITTDDGLAVHFDYGLTSKWCSIAMLYGRELSLFKHLGGGRERQKLMGWELLNLIIDRGGELHAHEDPKMEVVEIDSGKDLPRAKKVGA